MMMGPDTVVAALDVTATKVTTTQAQLSQGEDTAVLCVSANMHDNNNNNNASSSPQEKERKRIPWVDWCRTQSVYNVVAGHAWWTAVDHINLSERSHNKP